MSDTIAAIATAPGPSAIGVVRLSGPDTCTVLDRVFRPKNGRPMSRQEPRRLVLGDVLDRDGQVIDSALAVLFPGPGSYTGQDCGELQCHGSPVVLDAALAAMLAAGARQAKGGEFTRRAFLNGRMDLLQAEAVADLIDAETAQAAHNAVGQLEGVLSRTVAEIYDGLMAIVSRFYAVVDYPDEDIEDLTLAETERTLTESEQTLAALLGTFAHGRVLKSGAAMSWPSRETIAPPSAEKTIAVCTARSTALSSPQPMAVAMTTFAPSAIPMKRLTMRPMMGPFAPTAATATVHASPEKLPTMATSEA